MALLRTVLGGLLVAATFCVVSATSAHADPIRIEHERGTLELPGPAKRVATINWAFTETVIALGLDPVAVSNGSKNRHCPMNLSILGNDHRPILKPCARQSPT